MLGNFLSKLKTRAPARKSLYPTVMLRRPKHLIVIPPFRDIEKVNVKYPLIDPYASAEIKWIPDKKSLMYSLLEPVLSDRERKILHRVEEALTEVIDTKLSSIKDREKVMEYLQRKALSVMEDLGITVSKEVYEKMMYYIARDFFGMNEIEPLMHDPYIEDIGCAGLNSPIFIIHRRFGSIETNLVFRDFDYFSNFVIKLAERCGRYISYAVPLLDGSLPDGSRIQASLAQDVTTKGPTFSIRKFRKNPFSPIDLVNLGTCSPEIIAYLWFLMQHDASVLITGGVSTGKTTTLNVLSMFISPEDKIISIEDTREINLPHENWIPSVSRTGFGVPEAGGKKYGEITLFDLLKESFRQNPDYVIVGEIRGEEAYVMFQGMASGHPSLGTIHAGSVEDVIKRLETPPIDLSPSLIEALDLVIVMVNAKEKGKSARKIKEIIEIQSVDSRTGKAHFIKTFSWIPSVDTFRGSMENSELIRRASFNTGIPYSKIMKDVEERKAVIEWMARHDIIQFEEVYNILNLYHKDRSIVMEWVEKDASPRTIKTRRGEKILSATGLKIVGGARKKKVQSPKRA